MPPFFLARHRKYDAIRRNHRLKVTFKVGQAISGAIQGTLQCKAPPER